MQHLPLAFTARIFCELSKKDCQNIENIIKSFNLWFNIILQVVQEYERAVIFRLGRLRKGGAKVNHIISLNIISTKNIWWLQGPGIFFVIPCVDHFRCVDMRTVSFDVPPQEVSGRQRNNFSKLWNIFIDLVSRLGDSDCWCCCIFQCCYCWTCSLQCGWLQVRSRRRLRNIFHQNIFNWSADT